MIAQEPIASQLQSQDLNLGSPTPEPKPLPCQCLGSLTPSKMLYIMWLEPSPSQSPQEMSHAFHRPCTNFSRRLQLVGYVPRVYVPTWNSSS